MYCHFKGTVPTLFVVLEMIQTGSSTLWGATLCLYTLVVQLVVQEGWGGGGGFWSNFTRGMDPNGCHPEK